MATTTTNPQPHPAAAPAAPVATEQWPCANCHQLISNADRCPFCHGIQVKITKNETAYRALWIERVSPATTIRTSPPPPSNNLYLTSPSPDSKELMEIVRNSSSHEDTTSSNNNDTMDDTTAAALVGASSASSSEGDDYTIRPNNPVAFLLAATAAESPLPVHKSSGSGSISETATSVRIEDTTAARREERKKDRRHEPENSNSGNNNNTSATASKKQRILFAM